jgi:Big-like domain-containing protein
MHRFGLACAMTVLVMAACGGDGGTPPVPPSVESVEVQAPTAALIVGDSLQLTAVVHDDQGDILTDRPLTWGVTDSSILSISGTGRVVAVGKGTAVASASVDGHTGDITLTAAGLTFADLSAGDVHVCGRTLAGASYCWGTRPIATSGTLITADHKAYCWGCNNLGPARHRGARRRGRPRGRGLRPRVRVD